MTLSLSLLQHWACV